MIIYSLEPQTTRPESGEGGNSRGDIEKGLEVAEMEDQVSRAAASGLVLAHLEVLGGETELSIFKIFKNYSFRVNSVTLVGLLLAMLELKL